MDEIFDNKKIEERQELPRIICKEALAQLHNLNPTSKEGKVIKAIAHGIVFRSIFHMARNINQVGFYAGATNEALIEKFKNCKVKPDVAQTLGVHY